MNRGPLAKILDENRLSLASLAQREGVHVATAWRWATRGCKGVTLETFAVGGKRFTTEQAYARWLAKLNGDMARADLTQTAKQRQHAISAAERELSEAGI